MRRQFSIIIPARNEEAAIGATLNSVLESVASYLNVRLEDLRLEGTAVQVLMVDNESTDKTRDIVDEFVKKHGVGCVLCPKLGAPCARNYGTRLTDGEILVYVDADTRIPQESLCGIREHVERGGKHAGIFALAGDGSSWQSRCWWGFWNTVRLLPLPRAKALPAFMFCTREVFERFGPFDEQVQIGEEWPILAGLYRQSPRRLVYDRSITAFTSDRRMALQRFGYLRTFFKYVWAVLHISGRNGYPDSFRE